MLHIGLPHVNVLSKLDLVSKYGDLGKQFQLILQSCESIPDEPYTPLTDFNLDFYTEVQDLSHLTHALSTSHPRFNALTIAICDLVEDFGLVGFETLAVEDKQSMLHLMRVVDRTLGYAFVASTPTAATSEGETPPPQPKQKPSRDRAPNTDALFSSAMASIPQAPNVRDVQERWINDREAYDEWETGEWKREGAAAAEKKAKLKGKPTDTTTTTS